MDLDTPPRRDARWLYKGAVRTHAEMIPRAWRELFSTTLIPRNPEAASLSVWTPGSPPWC